MLRAGRCQGWDAVGVASELERVGLLDDAALEASSVVANCVMNRERQLIGVNSYTRELGFSPLAVITARLAAEGGPADTADTGAGDTGAADTADTADTDPAGAGGAGGADAPGDASAGWLDLCCGTGRALIQAAVRLDQDGLAGRAALVGIDLAGAFDRALPQPGGLELVCAPVASWAPGRAFDLITCVHGMHYVGDKLALLARAASWLTPTGQLVADLDLASIRLADGRPAGRRLASLLRAAGFRYDSRRRRISCAGRLDVCLPYRYLGADDRAGPNYTGQPAVHSYYTED
jgi:SAM-dependent methyltransferase